MSRIPINMGSFVNADDFAFGGEFYLLRYGIRIQINSGSRTIVGTGCNKFNSDQYVNPVNTDDSDSAPVWQTACQKMARIGYPAKIAMYS
jgi:hypothetical protein